MRAILLSIGEAIFGAIFTSLWNRFFPPKTAADQRAADLSAGVKEANDAIETKQEIDQAALADVQSDLDSRMRGSDGASP